ncbi:sodium:solute symporter [Alienimonas chondri]|uniref:Sodium/glucose cotransporter n=1 Tax=Alienimonas chondri TaxID=2681879 RepID=A0ABX1V783_9PLAN|nr:sodium:solute symporter [Alienimonas chondri]NNJ24100.1 Sodium/glucose cotransporter [Alienimonas chondri]
MTVPLAQSADAQSAEVSFGLTNWLVLIAYLAGMVWIGVRCSRTESGTEDFFLAGRRIPWWAAGLSIFGTQLSAITFMAIPATAYGDDWVRMTLNLMLLAALPVVALFYLPFYRRTGVATAYEYLERRFNLAVRWLASGLFILLQIGRMGVVLYLPAIALAAVTGMNVYVCLALMGVLATIYTVLGGIEAVIWTDVVQVVVLIGGVLISLAVITSRVGGVGELIEAAGAADKFQIVETIPADPPTPTPAEEADGRIDVPPWLSGNAFWIMVVGGFVMALTPYTTDQTVVQRYLTTPNEAAAVRSVWLNFWMTAPTALLFFGFGTALFVFYETFPGLPLPETADEIVPWFVVSQLPAGVAGLVIAGVFAAAMSSLDSSMNSVATAIVNDFHVRLRPKTTDKARLRLARLLTVVLGALGTGVAAVLASVEIKYLLDFFMTMLGLFGGGLGGLFALAVFTTRTNATGALVGLIVGTVITAGVQFATEVNGFLYAAIGFMICLVIGYGVSLLTKGDARDLAGLTIHTTDLRGRPAAG